MIRRFSISMTIAVAGITTTLSAQTPVSSEFTYQGQLRAPGLPAITTADFQFALFDAATAGTQIGVTLTRSNVALSNGTFNVPLNFGSVAFKGEARWLEVTVRSPAGVGGFTTLTPRQPLTATPHSSFSLNTRGLTVDAAGKVGIGTTFTGAERLTVAGDMILGGTTSGEYRHLQISSGLVQGYLFGAHQGETEGLHLGLNYFIDESGNHQFPHHGGSSRLSLRTSEIGFGASNVDDDPPADRLVVDEFGAKFLSLARFDAGAQMHIENVNDNFRIEDGNENPIWSMGRNLDGQPIFVLISPVTSDLEAGFYRDNSSGNGVMFADDKNFRAPNPADASTDIWYCCPEGPEAAIYVRGTGRLINGRATIELPDHFRSLASEPGMTIQLTPGSPNSRGLSFVKKSLDGIEVVELNGGTGNYEFDWRVEAIRKGWEDYKVIRPWMQSDKDADKAWQNRLKWIEERRAHGKPSPETNAATARPQN